MDSLELRRNSNVTPHSEAWLQKVLWFTDTTLHLSETLETQPPLMSLQIQYEYIGHTLCRLTARPTDLLVRITNDKY
jgi:hypothetical protein